MEVINKEVITQSKDILAEHRSIALDLRTHLAHSVFNIIPRECAKMVSEFVILKPSSSYHLKKCGHERLSLAVTSMRGHTISNIHDQTGELYTNDIICAILHLDLVTLDLCYSSRARSCDSANDNLSRPRFMS